MQENEEVFLQHSLFAEAVITLHLSREIRLAFTRTGSLNRIAIYIISSLLVQASIPTLTMAT